MKENTMNKFERFVKKASSILSSKIIYIGIIIMSIITSAIIIGGGMYKDGFFEALNNYSNEECLYLESRAKSVITDTNEVDLSKLTDKEIEHTVSENKTTKYISIYNESGRVTIRLKKSDNGNFVVNKITYFNETEYKVMVIVILIGIILFYALAMSAMISIALGLALILCIWIELMIEEKRKRLNI